MTFDEFKERTVYGITEETGAKLRPLRDIDPDKELEIQLNKEYQEYIKQQKEQQ